MRVRPREEEEEEEEGEAGDGHNPAIADEHGGHHGDGRLEGDDDDDEDGGDSMDSIDSIDSIDGDDGDDNDDAASPTPTTTTPPRPYSRPKRRSELSRTARAYRQRQLISRYVPLYNAQVRWLQQREDCGGGDGDDADDDYGTSRWHRTLQIGAVRWSRRERVRAYAALARHGRAATARVAAAVGSKTELEVRALLRALARAVAHRRLCRVAPRLLALPDVPAALEVGDQCDRAMEEAAHALACDEARRDAVRARRAYGPLHRVDREVAAAVDRLVEEGEGDAASGADDDGDDVVDDSNLGNGAPPAPAGSLVSTVARLLPLSNWIALAEDIFMNPGSSRPPDQNWRTLRDPVVEDTARPSATTPTPTPAPTPPSTQFLSVSGCSPALTADALAEFYALALSLTRRAVQAAIFFALSRTRATAAAGLRPAREDTTLVRREDVATALEVLRLPRDAHAYWAAAPRRCALDVVYERRSRTKRPLRLTTDEAEAALAPREAAGFHQHTARFDAALAAAGAASRHELDRAGSAVQGGSDGGESDESADASERESGSESETDGDSPDDASPADCDSDFDLLSHQRADERDRLAAAEADARLREQLHLPQPPSRDTTGLQRVGIDRHATAATAIATATEAATASEAGIFAPRRRVTDAERDWRADMTWLAEWEQYGPGTAAVLRALHEEEDDGRCRKKRRSS